MKEQELRVIGRRQAVVLLRGRRVEDLGGEQRPYLRHQIGELLCEVNNDKLELLPNINVNVRINSHERINVLTVPRGAVEAEGGQRFVFVVLRNALGVGKATLEKREIHVGIADATNYEVVGGLQEGEMVALPGDVDLKDKMPVRIVNTDVSYIRGRSESN